MAYRVDGNQSAIVYELEKAGVIVTDCAKIGNGHPDLVCWYPLNGLFRFLEVKMPGKKLNKNQLEWLHNNPKKKALTYTVDSVGEALRIFRIMK